MNAFIIGSTNAHCYKAFYLKLDLFIFGASIWIIIMISIDWINFMSSMLKCLINYCIRVTSMWEYLLTFMVILLIRLTRFKICASRISGITIRNKFAYKFAYIVILIMWASTNILITLSLLLLYVEFTLCFNKSFLQKHVVRMKMFHCLLWLSSRIFQSIHNKFSLFKDKEHNVIFLLFIIIYIFSHLGLI